MAKSWDIKRILRILLLLLTIAVMLPACAAEDEQAAVPTRDAEGRPVNSESIAKDQEGAVVVDGRNSCWAALIVTGLYDSIGKASMSMYSKITVGAKTLMMVAFAVWLSFRVLVYISSFKEVNPAEFWTEVFQKAFVCLACGIIASQPQTCVWVLNIFVFPIYNTFLEFGSEILNVATKNVDSKFLGFIDMSSDMACRLTGETTINFDAPEPGFPSAPKAMMECMICMVWKKLNLGFAMAFEAMKGGGSIAAYIMSVLVGLLIICCFTFVKIGFSFYLVDTMFRFGMMAIILPLLIMSFAFKATKQYAKKGFFTLLNSSAYMMFIAIVVSMAIMAMEYVNEEIIKKNQNNSSFKELSVSFMCLMMICFLLVSALGVAQEVTDKLVGGGGKASFQKKVAIVGKAILAWVTGGASAGLEKIAAVKKIKDKASNVKEKINKLAGRDS